MSHVRHDKQLLHLPVRQLVFADLGQSARKVENVRLLPHPTLQGLQAHRLHHELLHKPGVDCQRLLEIVQTRNISF